LNEICGVAELEPVEEALGCRLLHNVFSFVPAGGWQVRVLSNETKVEHSETTWTFKKLKDLPKKESFNQKSPF
jgi:hypothetical protein